MSSFLTNFNPNIKKVQVPYKHLKLRKKIHGINEFTDNPPLRRSSFLTDDECDEEKRKISGDYDTNIKGLHETNIGDIPNDEEVEDVDKENERLPDTVVDTMCTRLSEMNVKTVQDKLPSKNLLSESIKFSSTKLSLPDTVVSDLNSSVLQEIEKPLSSRKQLFSSNDEDDDDEMIPFNQQNIGIKQKNPTYAENIEYSDDDDDEIIQVLDSDDEEIIDKLQPKSMAMSDTFVNCSTNNGSLNDFFNQPPSLASNLAVTHSMIQQFKNGQGCIQEHVIKKSYPMDIIEDKRREMHESLRHSKESFELRKSHSFNDNEHEEIGPTDESDIENDNIVDLTNLDDSDPKSNAQLNDKPKSIPSTPIKTPSSSNKDKKAQQNSTPKQPKLKSTISKTIFVDTPPTNSNKSKKSVTNINIKFDLKISIKDRSTSDESNDSNSSSISSASESSVKKSHLKAIKDSPFIERKSLENASLTKVKVVKEKDKQNMEVLDEEKFHTPTHKKDDKPLIDEELNSMLTNLYGNSWKTPQVMSSFKIKKYREELRKSLAANNFESFVGSLSKDLESTRISSPKSEKPIRKFQYDTKRSQPIQYSSKKEQAQSGSIRNPKTTFQIPGKENEKSSNKKLASAINSSSDRLKTPVHKNIKTISSQNVPKTPLHELCDPDTDTETDESSSDEDFNPDDTWNASSDEDYESEKDRIKKRQSIKHEPLVFTMDDSLNEVLKKYEFRPPKQMEASIEKPMRRKLFTHTHYEDAQEPEAEKEEPKITPLKPSDFLSIPKKVFTPKTPIQKVIDKKASTPREVRTTPLSGFGTPLNNNLNKKDMLKRFAAYSFLKSLDAEANKMLCDPDALKYRENYKSKKNELAQKLFKLYNEKVFDNQLTNVPLNWNKKLSTTGGRCSNSRRGGVRNSLIELSDKVLTSADRLRCTLIHEMCHAAAWILSGENGHGSTWKKWTAKANNVFPELPKITVCHDYIIEYRYTYLCVNCHARSQTHSKSKKVEQIRCSLCKGAIQLFENKKNPAGQLELVPVQKKEPTAFAKFVKLKFKEVKKPYMNHKEVMQVLSSQFSSLTVEEKAQL